MMFVDGKYRVGDVVDYIDYDYNISVCVIISVNRYGDYEDGFESSYGLIIKGTDEVILGGAYEGRLSLNKEYIREKKIDNLLNGF